MAVLCSHDWSSMRVLGALLLVVVCCWSCRQAPSVLEAPLPFDPSIEWIVVENYGELLALRPTGSTPEAKVELDRLLELVRVMPAPSEGYILAVDPAAGTVPRWTVRAGSVALVGMYQLSGTGRGGCFADLLALDDGAGLRGPDPAAQDQPGNGGGGEEEETEAENGTGGEEGGEEGENGEDDEATGEDQLDEDDAPPLELPPEVPILVDSYYGVRCGSFSTIFSLLQLGWIQEGDAVEDGKLKPEFVTSFDQYLEAGEGMKPSKMLEAHQSNLPNGQQIELKQEHIVEGQGTKKQQMDALKRAKARVDDGWDCIALFTWHNPPKDGKPQKSTEHAEQIKKMTIEGSTAAIETQDAINQGDLHGKNVTYPPKTHKWKIKPPLEFDGERDIFSLAIDCFRARPAENGSGQ